MYRKLNSLLSIKIKATSCILVGFLLLSTFMPLSNLEIKALGVSLDVIENTPTMLDVVSLSKLNDIVMTNIMNEINNIGGLGDSWPKSKKPVNTNTECLLAGKTVKGKLSLGISLLIDKTTFSGMSFADKTIKWLYFESNLAYRFEYTIAKNIYLDSLNIQMARVIPILSLPRADLNDISIYNVGVLNLSILPI